MASYGIRAICLCVVAVATSLFALPARLFDAVGRFVLRWPDAKAVRFLADLTRGPALLITPGGQSVDAATYQHNRHEAGLAKLGAVRHR